VVGTRRWLVPFTTRARRQIWSPSHTSLANAGLECSRHNRHKHRTKLQRTRITTDHIETTRANGTAMGPTGQRTRTDIIRARLPRRSVHPDARNAVESALRNTGRIDAVYIAVVDGEYRLAA